MEGKKKIQPIFWALLFMVIIPLSAFGVDGQIEQTSFTTFPIVIDQSGKYTLTSDLMVSSPDTQCIQIDADDVILDLQGHRLIGQGKGSGPKSIGVFAHSGNNISVINGTVKGFFCGVSLSGTNHEVKNIDACHNNSQGIKAESSLISNCKANNNGSRGIEAESCTITDCRAHHNGSHGIEAKSSTIINCRADHNGFHGIHASDKCLIEECAMEKNNKYGLFLTSDYSYAVKNRGKDNSLGNFYGDGLNYMPTSGSDANHELKPDRKNHGSAK